jgi:drug/metabolite transporter (DMT)-like permease
VFALGVLAALAASALFNVGVALQAFEAREAPKEQGLRVSLLAALLRRPLWLLGLFLGLVGVAPQVYAFAVAPFAVAQTALTAGLVLLLYLGARHLHERVGISSVCGVVLIVAAVGLVSWGVPERHDAHRGGVPVLAVVAGIGVIAVLPFVLQLTGADGTFWIVVGAGAAFAATNVATKLLSDDLGLRHWVETTGWGVVALAMGIVATITEMTAFQRAAATIVAPTVTAIQTFLPIVLEPLFLREDWRSIPAFGIPLVAGLACAALGVVLVTRSSAVSKLAAAAT